jgi:anti-sigma regulatory factor (Ser/Thr protein kinase)
MVLSREQSITLFRILQEILTNVARHAQATNVHITLEQYGEHVSLQVEDNGRGITGVEQSGTESIRPAGHAPPRRTAGWHVRHSGNVGNWNTGHRPDPPVSDNR